MTRSQADVGVDLCQVLVESYAVSERMNQIVLEHLDPGAWRAKLPGSKGRTITWGAQFEKTGARTIVFEISYLLEKAGDEWRILSYISRSDQNEEMKKEGLL